MGTSIAVGCAVGIPSCLAVVITFGCYIKTKRRFKKEEQDYVKDEEMGEIDKDLTYDNLDQLRLDRKESSPLTSSAEPSEASASEDGKINMSKLRPHSGEVGSESEVSVPITSSPSTNKTKDVDNNSQNKKQRYVPAYRKKFRASVSSLANSRNSSATNLHHMGSGPAGTSNSSLNSGNTSATEHFYNVPVIDDPLNGVHSSKTSIELVRTLQQSSSPPYHKKSGYNTPHNLKESKSKSPRSTVAHFYLDDENDIKKEYDLKNNYDHENEHEIQEEDQYENEFTNYSENKRAYIESLRPKK